ncbi:MAG: delta-60 repeat domain-containing protein [Rhodanobacteraceae bacterium]
MFTSMRFSALVAVTIFAACARAQSVDPFNPVPGANPIAVAVQADGKILLGGDFSDIGGTVRGGVARLNVDGSIDTSFVDPNVDSEVRAIAVQPDGRILIGGAFDQAGGQPRHDLARLNADGSLDTGFSDPDLHNGAASGTVWSIALQPDGKILIAGDFTEIGATAQSYLARLSAAGARDTGFADPQLCCLPARSVALQADGKILVAGSFSQAGGSTHFYLARYSTSGSLDTAFPADEPPGPIGSGIAVGGDGSIYVDGGYLTSNQMNSRLVSELSTSGALVSSYDDLSNDGSADTFVLQPDGKLLIGGTFETVASQSRHALMRLNADGTLDTDFRDLAFSLDATHPNGTIYGLAAQADGRILAVGNFTLVDGQPRQLAARVATGDFVTSALVVQGSGSALTATWYRLGDGPELAQPPVLEHSTDGVNFTAFGPMVRVANGWQVTAPYNVHGALFYLQAIGTTASGAEDGSVGRVASGTYTNDTIFHGDFE